MCSTEKQPALGSVMEREFASLHRVTRSIHGGVSRVWGTHQGTLKIEAFQAGQSMQEGFQERFFT